MLSLMIMTMLGRSAAAANLAVMKLSGNVRIAKLSVPSIVTIDNSVTCSYGPMFLVLFTRHIAKELVSHFGPTRLHGLHAFGLG
ncbi:hypothetical protein CA13_73260 [Planctomycetes bacterium CA13]|uniref:Secreted protein n=1 Tax=Novipirellula herctigrandis TaxID=2527986 RepID=A0A5C5YLD5_9BACT|nr:hypothetical protein CA13_73260 [Planctomycetes bacterium CA13]